MKREHYIERLSVFLIAVVLIAGVVGCAGGGGVEYNLTITSTEGGSVTPEVGTHTYDEGEEVDLVAIADAGYHFVNWTGGVDDIADVNDATTTITMNGDYTITANFALGTVTYALTVTSTAGGNVTTPVEGTHTYDAGKVVDLVATPDTGYRFVNWTGNVSTIANVNAATTTITMNGDYSIMANFEVIPAVQYDLATSSTAGGDVTTPGEGTRTYDAGTVVNLVATPDAGYRFVNWTGGGADIGNAIAASTTITMNADHTITAHFALGVFIDNVPDASQPPTQTLPSTQLNWKNFCAPMAMANILEYWDDVVNHANAQNVTAGLIPETVAEYIGWFMDTNNNGSPARANGNPPNASLLGTYNVDIAPGTLDFVRWDANYTPPPVAPPFPLPAGKLGYNWSVLTSCDTNYNNTLSLYKNEIDNGRPLVVSFDYWNPVSKGINYTDPKTGETIDVFVWGDYIPNSLPPNPEEFWTYGLIGHAVTGVGYILNWDPDGAGPIPSANWVIVHDNWPTTPKNVAIPWQNWMCLFPVSP